MSADLTVYGNDHRRHGRTAPSAADFGDFGEGGFDLLVEDMVRLSRIAKEEFPVSHSSCWGTAWVPSPRNSTYSITAGRSLSCCGCCRRPPRHREHLRGSPAERPRWSPWGTPGGRRLRTRTRLKRLSMCCKPR